MVTITAERLIIEDTLVPQTSTLLLMEHVAEATIPAQVGGAEREKLADSSLAGLAAVDEIVSKGPQLLFPAVGFREWPECANFSYN